MSAVRDGQHQDGLMLGCFAGLDSLLQSVNKACNGGLCWELSGCVICQCPWVSACTSIDSGVEY